MTIAEDLFSDDDVTRWLARTGGHGADSLVATPAIRRPVHVFYGGASRFRRETPAKLRSLAVAALDAWAPLPRHLIERVGVDVDETLAEEIHGRLRIKLEEEPIEDLRIDFEDGLGACTDDEEDAEAVRAGAELARLTQDGDQRCPPFVGLRLRALNGATASRSLRTLRLFVGSFLEGGGEGALRVTLPKVASSDEVACFAEVCDRIEDATHDRLRLVMEIMVESPAALLRDGRLVVRRLVEAAAGRVESVHLGTYDYTASLGVAPRYQRADHPAAELARQCLLLDLAGTHCEISDGATHRLPLPVHRAPSSTPLTEQQAAENEAAVAAGLRLHAASVTRALAAGIRRGWDLHPNQLLARYAAVFAFFLEDKRAQAERLAGFLARRGKGGATGVDWDDAASARALLDHFRRGRACGAFTDDDFREARLAPEGTPLDEERSSRP